MAKGQKGLKGSSPEKLSYNLPPPTHTHPHTKKTPKIYENKLASTKQRHAKKLTKLIIIYEKA